MSSNLFEEERLSDLQRATQTYEDAKQNYQRLVRLAFQETDSKKRTDLLNAIQTENARLVSVVEALLIAWSEQATQEGARQMVDLDKELQTFKQQLEQIQDKQDNLVQLQTVLSTVSGQTETNKTYYYAYIVAVLVLLVIVFVLFVFSYFRSAPPTVLPALPELPALPAVEG